ncbi:VOC family protein [Melghirimyces profundicolus]|uniref:VOC family protein n=1 Tax=Melghirimyces profundicolus TaxID=1242148 RepID=UPI0011B28A7A|nr:VOC family protein [Melghirimyces profundicolus]
MSETIPLHVLRITDLNRSLTFYRDMLGFEPDWEDPERGTVRLVAPDGDRILLTSDPELDIRTLFAPETPPREPAEPEPAVPEERLEPESEEDQAAPDGGPDGEQAPNPEAEPVGSYDPFGEEEPKGQVGTYQILEANKEEPLRFPGENLEYFQERLAMYGLPDLLLEENPGVEQVLKIQDPDGYRIALYESLRLDDEEVIALYRKGPDLLEGAILGLENEDLEWETEEGETIRQLILQIVDFDLEMMQRIKWALAESGRKYTIPLYDPEEWAEKLHYASRPVQAELGMFRFVRDHVLSQLETVSGAMDRYLVSEHGNVEVRTMVQVAGESVREQVQTIMETRRRYGK